MQKGRKGNWNESPPEYRVTMRTSSVFESELSSWWAGQGQEETTSSSILDRVVVFDDASKKEEKVIMEREESGKMVLDPERDER